MSHRHLHLHWSPLVAHSVQLRVFLLLGIWMDYLAYIVDPIPVPTRYSQAKGHLEWDNAMTEEINALHANHTWDMVPRPQPSIPVIGSRWVYAIKVHPDGTLEQFKGRVVAQDFCQEYGIDFE
ncbi:unnamed protein product [Linum trigynum]|uniref:Reverse transcriptase Ty1/copia-type domain-containing protein n=1 Tax=Linum trigynum TaxID=586398 RepID=A0AAV2D954_9ROSI